MKTRVLPVLGILFALTLVGRTVALSTEVNTGHAKPAADTHAAPQATPETGHAQSTPVEAQDKQCLSGDVLKTINAKMEKLKHREHEIAELETAFSAIEARLKKQLAVVEAAKNALNKDVETRSTLATNDIAHLTTMYETMKPKQAALIFNKMDSKFAAGFLREMQSGQAGLILAAMKPTQAYEISLVIASRNAKYRPKADTNLP